MSARQLIFVRHALAGDKHLWQGPDDRRPLDPTGARDAQALVDQLRGDRIERLISSPTLRCTQTLRPLSDDRDLSIETDPGLNRDAGPAGAVALLDDPAAHLAVICSHGEVLRPLLRELQHRGAAVPRRRNRRHALLAKGTFWRVKLRHDGRVATFEHIDPTP